MGIDRSEGEKDSQVKSGRPRDSHPRPKSDNGQQQGGDQKEEQIENDESAPAEIAFQFAPKRKEHVHLDGKPKKSGSGVGKMHKSVSGDLPDPA